MNSFISSWFIITIKLKGYNYYFLCNLMCQTFFTFFLAQPLVIGQRYVNTGVGAMNELLKSYNVVTKQATTTTTFVSKINKTLN